MGIFDLLARSNAGTSRNAASLMQKAVEQRQAERAARLNALTQPRSNASARPAKVDRYEPAAPSQKAEPGTYSFQRKAELKYSMKLQFDLGVFTRTVEKIANGDLQSIESAMAGEFGFAADLNFSGYQTLQDNGQVDADSSLFRNAASGVKNQSAAALSSRDVSLQAFRSEASSIRRNMVSHLRDGHRLATNSLSFRFQMDNKMSARVLHQFNAQTTAIATDQPDVAPSYFGATDQMALQAPTQAVERFFNLVENHLSNYEQQLTAKAEGFFDTAASELGFSGALVDSAKENLMGSIDSFFNRVEGAMSRMESHYTAVAAERAADLAGRFAGPSNHLHRGFLTTA